MLCLRNYRDWVNESRWWSYVERVAGGAALSHVAERSGFDKSALSRWKRGDRPDPYFVVKFARAYGLPVVEALAEAGLITDEEAAIREVPIGVRDLSSEELTHELALRLGIGESVKNRRVFLSASAADRDRLLDRNAQEGFAAMEEASDRARLQAVAHDPGVAPEDDAEDERD